MQSIATELMQTTALARRYLDAKSRREIAQFVRSKWNADGGVCGRDQQSDLYYTLFGASCLRSLGAWVPVFRLWKYLQQFGNGADLDRVHLICFARLRTLFPMRQKNRTVLFERIESQQTESAYDSFLNLIVQDKITEPVVPVEINEKDPTPGLAAALILNGVESEKGIAELWSRYSSSGGFCAGKKITEPDLLSTATALFALQQHHADFDAIRTATLEYVESLWSDSGGFAGHVADPYEDVEYTAYALLSIGCLIRL